MVNASIYSLLLAISFWGNCRDNSFGSRPYWGICLIMNTALLIEKLNDLGVFK